MLEMHKIERASMIGKGARFVAAAALMGLLSGFAACGGGGSPSGTSSGGPDSSSSGGGGAPPATPWKMGEAFSTAAPSLLSVDHPLQPSPLWGKQKKPFPTNAEWMNLVLGTGKNPINILPYVINATETGFEVSVPKITATAQAVTSAVEHDISFDTAELLSSREITGYDLLSVTMQWSGGGDKTLTAPLVRGMPYATAVYAGLTPIIGSSHAIVKVNDDTKSPVLGDRFAVEFNNGQKWMLYASASISLAWNAKGLTASAPFNGHLRAAVVSAAPDAIDVLDTHRSAYPTGGDVAVSVLGDDATIGFNWKKQGSGPLLMMALPHHLDSLGDTKRTDVATRTLKGDMIAVPGDAWTMTEKLSAISWNAPANLASDKAPAVKAALAEDAKFQPAAEDPYAFGKEIAKLARLALIADELKDEATAKAIRDQMKASLDPWLDGTNKDALKYDNTWSGVVSTDGLADPAKDFGQGYYNDHHFHYGYFLYAAAAVAKVDKQWYAARKEAILLLARDIANPSTTDSAFPQFRNKDWFAGHSWAAGLFEFADSRNQESSSEAVNAWYGLYLLGLAAEDSNLTNVGRVLLATEIHAVQRYWHIRKDSAIYPAPFAANAVVGVLWSNKVDYTTFFGALDEYVHGIQMIPFTPISEALLEPEWVKEEYPVVSAKLTDKSEAAWKGFIYMDHAIIDPKTAWEEAQGLTGYDSGNSKTNTLYWIATRP